MTYFFNHFSSKSGQLENGKKPTISISTIPTVFQLKQARGAGSPRKLQRERTFQTSEKILMDAVLVLLTLL